MRHDGCAVAPSNSSPDRPPFDLDVLYREQAASLYAWACLRTAGDMRQWVTPDDLTQEVWVRAARAAAGAVAADGRLRAWLFTIAKHVLYEVRRAAERERRLGRRGGTTRLLALAQVPDDITSLTQQLARDDALQTFLRRCEELDDEDRMLLIHVGLEAMPQREAAARFGTSYEALAKRWQRLRDRLRSWPSAKRLLP